VATSLASFTTYQIEEAWTWEHLALTRARPLTGDESLLADIENVRRQVLASSCERSKVKADVLDMRTRLHEAKTPKHWLDVGTGAGGLQDIDLLAQTGTLLAGETLRAQAEQVAIAEDLFDLNAADRGRLEQAEALFWAMRMSSRLVFGDAWPDEIGEGAGGFLCRITEFDTLEGLETALSEARQSVADIVSRALTA
jgi:glutamate-ammonia-ligase adenylyltransferase